MGLERNHQLWENLWPKPQQLKATPSELHWVCKGWRGCSHSCDPSMPCRWEQRWWAQVGIPGSLWWHRAVPMTSVLSPWHCRMPEIPGQELH